MKINNEQEYKKTEKKKRQKKYMTIFINGKQKRVKRPQTLDGISVDEFLSRNADPIWLHQNEMREDMVTSVGQLEEENDSVPF